MRCSTIAHPAGCRSIPVVAHQHLSSRMPGRRTAARCRTAVKSVFQVHGVDAAGRVVLRRQLKRRHVLAFRLPREELPFRHTDALAIGDEAAFGPVKGIRTLVFSLEVVEFSYTYRGQSDILQLRDA
jgi:hypothetical protein